MRSPTTQVLTQEPFAATTGPIDLGADSDDDGDDNDEQNHLVA